MKKLLAALILFLPFFSQSIFAQNKQLFGLGPIDWDSSKEEVNELMNEKFNLKARYEKEDALGFEGGDYFGENIYIWAFFFTEDKLTEADLIVNNTGRPVGAIFSKVTHNIVETYGNPDLYKPDDWSAEWFFYQLTGKKLNATIKISPYSNEKMTSIKVSYVKIY